MTNRAYAKSNGDGLLCSILCQSAQSKAPVYEALVSIYQTDMTSFSEDGRGVLTPLKNGYVTINPNPTLTPNPNRSPNSNQINKKNPKRNNFRNNLANSRSLLERVWEEAVEIDQMT